MTFKRYMKIVVVAIVPLIVAITVGTFFIMKLSNPTVQFATTIVFALLLGYPFTRYLDWLTDKEIL